ncbi:methionine adenosyltransferase [Mycoplasma sp. ES3157-GEN-MYC]|uniref:methionine adenosyltransferase n=1 Tax=Mycoplasma miroungigenitalium TaxID=754515 RepID=UPI001C0FA644|nr:methionine adenosyltransferase [Mycoplasma miroungigenitalium]MBU4690294.1 methionine adenosyltransferase [Mycoplasma miroungigenitalium]MBU4691561.1 methionine adenosyltransferase [Mycoplasma miroungigenitalium]
MKNINQKISSNKERNLFTSESVGQGHPDKICDQISDRILDAYLEQDSNARVAIETMATGNIVLIAGEVSSNAKVDAIAIAKSIFDKLDYPTVNIKFITDIKQQSPDISRGVVLSDDEIGAGDQGIMFGYACNETSNYMPLGITLAHELVKFADKLRQIGQFKWAKADMKSQVTVEYDDEGKILDVDTVLMSIQHDENYNDTEFKEFIINNIISVVLEKYNLKLPNKILINPTGRFVIGGPIGDTGLTGRKIIVDTYGGYGRHGGGAFSGKDSTKVDRSAAYACRWIAKNIVATKKLCNWIEIQVSYAIGVAKPVSINVKTDGNRNVELIKNIITNIFDLRPQAIIKELNLRKPIFGDTSYFGHFGRDDLDLPWERTNKVKDIETYLKHNGF